MSIPIVIVPNLIVISIVACSTSIRVQLANCSVIIHQVWIKMMANISIVPSNATPMLASLPINQRNSRYLILIIVMLILVASFNEFLFSLFQTERTDKALPLAWDIYICHVIWIVDSGLSLDMDHVPRMISLAKWLVLWLWRKNLIPVNHLLSPSALKGLLWVDWFLTSLDYVVLIPAHWVMKRFLRWVLLKVLLILMTSIYSIELGHTLLRLDRVLSIQVVSDWNLAQERVAIATTSLTWYCSRFICLFVHDAALLTTFLGICLDWVLFRLTYLHHIILLKIVVIILIIITFSSWWESTIFVEIGSVHLRCWALTRRLNLCSRSLGIPYSSILACLLLRAKTLNL